MDLFEHRAAYPNAPGYKEATTSKAAAESIADAAPRLALMCLGTLHYHGPLTADEIATKCDKSVLTIRPRITELAQQGKIEPTGELRKNESGRRAKVWKVKDK